MADLTLKRGGSSRPGCYGLERRVGAPRGAWGEGRAGAVEHGHALAVPGAQQLMALAVDRRPERAQTRASQALKLSRRLRLSRGAQFPSAPLASFASSKPPHLEPNIHHSLTVYINQKWDVLERLRLAWLLGAVLLGPKAPVEVPWGAAAGSLRAIPRKTLPAYENQSFI